MKNVDKNGKKGRWKDKLANAALEKLLNIFEKTKFDMDSCENGICIKYEDHKRIHKKAYYRVLAKELKGAETKEQVKKKLIAVKKKIADGSFAAEIAKI